MEQVLINISGKPARVRFQGRKYLVASATLIVPGVLNGSRGPLFYPLSEIRINPEAWNHTPIVVYHPKQQGQPISARSPRVLEKQQVGLVFAARANGKLSAKLYFDEERTKKVDNRVYKALLNGEPMELSTGLHLDSDPAPEGSTHNGVKYSYVAKNFRPDHLAILPDQIGACSLRDGCGLNVNSEGRIELDLVTNALDNSAYVENPKGKWQPPEAGDAPAAVKAILRTVYSQWRDKHPSEDPKVKAQGAQIAWGAVHRAGWTKDQKTGKWKKRSQNNSLEGNMLENVTKKEGNENLPASAFAYVPDRNKPSTWKLRIDDKAHVGGAVAALGKGYRGEKVSIPSGALAAVKAKVRRAWLKFNPGKSRKDMPSVIANEEQVMDPLTDDQRAELIDELIGNCDCGWDEEDRETLNGFDDEKLQKFIDNVTRTHTSESKSTSSETIDLNSIPMSDLADEMKRRKEMAGNDDETTTHNRQPMTAEEWLESAPDEVRATFKYAHQIESEQKDKLIQKLTANIEDNATRKIQAERLKRRSIEDLKADVELLPVKKQKEPTDNTSHDKDPEAAWLSSAISRMDPSDDGDDALPLPTINFSKEGTDSAEKVGVFDASHQDPSHWLQTAPASVRELVKNAFKTEQEKKQEIIDILVANIEDSSKRFKMRDRLESRPLAELRDLLDMIPEGSGTTKKTNYTGAAGAPAQNRVGDDDLEDVLPLPVMKYGS